MKKSVLILVGIFLMPHLIHAQFSLKPKPLPDCKTFLITEFGYLYRINSPLEGRRKHPHYFVSNLGLMVNLSEKYSLGAFSYASYVSSGDLRLGLKVRGRRWLGSENSINISGGIILWDPFGAQISPGFTSDLSLNIRDILIVELLVEITPFRSFSHYNRSDLAIYTGIKTGSGWKPGFVVSIAVVILGAIGGVAFAVGGGD